MAVPYGQQPMAVAQPMPGYESNYPQAVPPQEAAADDPAAKLQKLKKMLDDGLIDADDYEKKKDEVLAAM